MSPTMPPTIVELAAVANVLVPEQDIAWTIELLGPAAEAPAPEVVFPDAGLGPPPPLCRLAPRPPDTAEGPPASELRRAATKAEVAPDTIPPPPPAARLDRPSAV
mmetsp:Transcript_50872/g.108010  ORF Transcript_50872/g.108010 Transcript_50872/m.108010 type:complete len:105 (+) Transcript_50872:636-950(+)